MNRLRKILTRIGERLQGLKRQLDVMADIRITLILLALIGFVVVAMPQGRDVMTGLVDDANAVLNEDGLTDQSGAAVTRWFALWLACVWAGLNIWYWSHLLCRTDPDMPHPTWFNWLRRVLGVLPLLFATWALLRVAEFKDVKLGVLLFAASAGLLFLFFIRRPARLVAANERGRAASKKDGEQSELGAVDWTFIGASLLTALVMLVLFAIPGVRTATAWTLGPAAVAFGALACIVPVTSLLIWWTRRVKFPIVSAAFVLLVVFSEFNDNHTVRALPGEVRARPSIEEAYKRWRGLHEPTDPVVLVAASGGASRAAYWTGTVLRELENADGARGFSHDVFAISSVSGGTLGAVGYSAWVAERQSRLPQSAPTPTERLQFVRSFAGADYLSPAVAGLLFPDTVQRFLPVPLLPSRATSLEESWEMSWRRSAAECASGSSAVPAAACPRGDRMEADFLSIWEGVLDIPAVAPRHWVPIVLANGTHAQTGKRIVTAPVRISPDVIEDSYDFFDVYARPIRASTAIHNSARFPVISPAGTLNGAASNGHVVDGGYFENGGLETLIDLARYIHEIDPGRRILIVEINNDDMLPLEDTARCPKPGDETCAIAMRGVPRSDPSPLLGGLSSVLGALYMTRDSRAVLAAKRASVAGGLGKVGFFQFRLITPLDGRTTAMSWSLSQTSRDYMDVMFGADGAEIAEVLSRRDYTPARRRDVQTNLERAAQRGSRCYEPEVRRLMAALAGPDSAAGTARQTEAERLLALRWQSQNCWSRPLMTQAAPAEPDGERRGEAHKGGALAPAAPTAPAQLATAACHHTLPGHWHAKHSS